MPEASPPVKIQEKQPKLVCALHEAVSERLGRPAYCRRAKDQPTWWVSDPVFSFVQHGMKKGQTGYRVGYHVRLGDAPHVAFFLVHSPLMARLFKKNLQVSTLVSVARETARFRKRHIAYWSSSFAENQSEPVLTVASRKIDRFLASIEEFDRRVGLGRDLFPRVPNSGINGGPAPVAGNDFFFMLADKKSALQSKINMHELVDISWPLFLCLYPIDAVERRNASLARSLRSKQISPRCEFSLIQHTRGDIARECRGDLQAAHIKPHSLGGSDRMENGLWLCQYHHKMTERKLKGRRDRASVQVRYIG